MSNVLLNEAPVKHDTLNPKLWDIQTNTLKPEVKEKIMDIVDDFCDGLAKDDIKFKLKDIKLVGSNCSYNYNDKSDLDIHLVMDTQSLRCPDNLYPLLYSSYRSIWNKNHDVDFYGVPVEIFVETDDTVDMNADSAVLTEESSPEKKALNKKLKDWYAKIFPETPLNPGATVHHLKSSKNSVFTEFKNNPNKETFLKAMNNAVIIDAGDKENNTRFNDTVHRLLDLTNGNAGTKGLEDLLDRVRCTQVYYVDGETPITKHFEDIVGDPRFKFDERSYNEG